ncbi:MAG: hypothetical protein V7772_09410, partial [Pseudomonas profundi]|uniref:hypothetical protein n=1 Tax=Pseudomonas profundi TaxID=1981513 RepID=UPI0030014246
ISLGLISGLINAINWCVLRQSKQREEYMWIKPRVQQPQGKSCLDCSNPAVGCELFCAKFALRLI